MKLTKTELFYMSFLAEELGITAKDCTIQDEGIVFLVEKEKMGKAIGAKGINVKILSQKFGKKVDFLVYSEDIKKFVEENLDGIIVNEIKNENNKVIIEASRKNELDLGKNTKKINIVREVLKKLKGL